MKKVYLIRAAHFYKIGISANVSSRLKSIQTGCPIKCEYIGYIPTDSPEKMEKELHDGLQNCKTYGEWFDLGEDRIRMLIVDYGLQYIIDPLPIIREDFHKINNSDALKEARSITTMVMDLTKIYEEHFPGRSLTEIGKKMVRKLVLKYNYETVVKCFVHLCGKYDDGKKILDKLTVVCWSFNKYGRHIPDELWKLYAFVVNSKHSYLAEGLIAKAMSDGLELDEDFHQSVRKQCYA